MNRQRALGSYAYYQFLIQSCDGGSLVEATKYINCERSSRQHQLVGAFSDPTDFNSLSLSASDQNRARIVPHCSKRQFEEVFASITRLFGILYLQIRRGSAQTSTKQIYDVKNLPNVSLPYKDSLIKALTVEC